MPVDRDKFLAELDALTDEEIERRLPQWDREQLALVQQYIDQRTRWTAQEQQRDAKPLEQAQKQAKDARDVAITALALAKRSSTVAVAALILSVGAMLAALIAGVIAYLVLKN